MEKAAEKQLYDLVIGDLPVPLFVVDASYRIVEFNQAAECMTGWSRKDVLGRSCSDILGSSLCRGNCPIRESLRSGKPCMEREAFVRTRDQEQKAIFLSCAVVADEKGNLVRGVEIFRDASAEKKLEAQKKNIISLFTHDLKAPLTIAGGFVRRMLAGKVGEVSEKQRQYLENIGREVGRLESYIHSFLEISRLEAGQIELQLQPLALDGLLVELVEGFRLPAAEKDISLALELPESLPRIQGDSLLLVRVFANLLDNGIKYSSAGASIEVRAALVEGGIEVSVRDQGVGIAPDKLDYIFDSFYQIPQEARKEQGTGLGLSAVQAIVEAHGGSIRVSSTPCVGSCFVVFLPSLSGDQCSQAG